MATGVKRFEDLIAWQKARILTKTIYAVTRAGLFAKDYGLRDQIRRAAVSIMSNVAEGFEKGTPAEFHNSLRIAKGSCAEVRSQLYVAFDAEYLAEEVFVQLLGQAEEVARVLGGLRASVERYCTNR
jgi:four helix bundle protein